MSQAFPVESLLPRNETNAQRFVSELYPLFDGRDVTIGILDTGVDPGIQSLRYMTDGCTPKLIDIVDCTGSGDVDVSDERVAKWTTENVDGVETASYWEVVGVSGRTIKLCGDWNICPFPEKMDPSLKKTIIIANDRNASSLQNETSDSCHVVEVSTDSKQQPKEIRVRVGFKPAYELFPLSVINRVKAERKKMLDKEIGNRIAAIHLKKASLECSIGTKSNKKPTLVELWNREDLDAYLEVLTSKDWYDEDPGPVYDCVVFFDGSDYRAVIDVQENGDLRGVQALTTYFKERQYSTFGIVDQMNYAVNFYDDGKVLSVVCDITPHGTHVASIAASAECNRNGVAPGAKLVSLKIGDTRLGGMETGSALVRALTEAIRHKCDVINVSYGEDVVVNNTGRFMDLADELVWKHNIVFCSSAGNSGPALSTVTAPAVFSASIGIAASVSPAMMESQYSIRLVKNNSDFGEQDGHFDESALPETTYTWSSTGPTLDGDNGVSVTSPGAAITNVSNWCLQKSRLMNGTSMSCPHATGCVALLISGCKASGIPVSPARIRRALQNTAMEIPNTSTVQQGWGMIQVDKAFEHLLRFKDDIYEDVNFTTEVCSQHNLPRGIYLRQFDETSVRQGFLVRVDPQFRREEKAEIVTQKTRINFEMHFLLESTMAWVTAPRYFTIANEARQFKIEVDPTNLEPGLHTARVNAYDSIEPDKKVIFSVPITVAKPMPIQRILSLGILEFDPTEVKRFFIVPPAGATWMDVEAVDLRDVNSNCDASSRFLLLHTVQLLPHASHTLLQKERSMNLMPSQTEVTSIAVEERQTIEVNVSRYWSTVGTTKISLKITFRGIRPVPNQLNIFGGACGGFIRMYSDLADEVVNPKAKLTKWQTPLRPTFSSICPLGDRDAIPLHEKEIYQLILTYDFEQDEKGAVVPRLPALQGLLYESDFESQAVLFFDSEKKYLGMSDTKANFVVLPKGSIVARVQVRHNNPVKLEKLISMIMFIERNLTNEINLDAYPTKAELLAGDNPFVKQSMKKGSALSVFFAEPSLSKLPSKCKPGDILLGSMILEHEDRPFAGENKKPGGFLVSYNVGPKPTENQLSPEVPSPDDYRTTEEKMYNALRDLKIQQLKLAWDEKEGLSFDNLYKKLDLEYPDFVPLRVARLQYLDSRKNRSEILSQIVDAADAVTQSISSDEVALTMGRTCNPEDLRSVANREDMKMKRDYLVEALSRMALAYADMKTEESSKKFSETCSKLYEWGDIDPFLLIEREKLAGRLGIVLQTMNKLLAKDVTSTIKTVSRIDLLEQRAAIFQQLGYDLFVYYDKNTRIISSPASYRIF